MTPGLRGMNTDFFPIWLCFGVFLHCVLSQLLLYYWMHVARQIYLLHIELIFLSSLQQISYGFSFEFSVITLDVLQNCQIEILHQHCKSEKLLFSRFPLNLSILYGCNSHSMCKCIYGWVFISVICVHFGWWLALLRPIYHLLLSKDILLINIHNRK